MSSSFKIVVGLVIPGALICIYLTTVEEVRKVNPTFLSELKMLHSSVQSYKARYGQYPKSGSDYNGPLNFVEQLSKIPVNDPRFKGDEREMFARFRSSGMTLSTNTYDKAESLPTTAIDPWGNPYIYVYSKKNDYFYILNAGSDGNPGTEDDIRSDQLNGIKTTKCLR